ncbi:MAG: cobaltochelatase subunit CobN [Firmicutes bacterium]|nr:cobaltochelatase subunit CobN [Bacillota bacterium]
MSNQENQKINNKQNDLKQTNGVRESTHQEDNLKPGEQADSANFSKRVLDGIFHPDSEAVFSTLAAYQNWYGGLDDAQMVVGILTHYENWSKKKAAVEEALVRELEHQGIRVIPVFSYSSADEESGVKGFRTIISDYFSSNGKLRIDGLINFQMQAATGNTQSGDLFSQSVDVFKEMNIPVFRPVVSRLQNQQQWEGSLAGLSAEISWAFTTSEMMGMIEPIIIGTRKDAQDMLGTTPIPERISRLVARIIRRIELKKATIADKKIVLMLHCSPCAGVEATLGSGAGLNVFESVVRMLKTLKAAGYQIANIPADGPALKKMMLDKKAYQDFRWTTVEDIVKAGGDIYRMPLSGQGGYNQFYEKLDPLLRAPMEAAWGPPPGEGMVFENQLVITGLNFGNVWVMLQPKRGCYGPKCTGEVCKILHDPACPPPHQYLATYRYIDELLKAHAVVHVGTAGSLEHLPGKTNALSEFCWPDVVIGNLPNFYCYNAAIGVEGVGTKRRNYAVVLDYLPSCLNTDYTRIDFINELGSYLEAVDVQSQQVEVMQNSIKTRINQTPEYRKIVEKEVTFLEGVKKLKGLLTQSITHSFEQENHIWGEVPKLSHQVSYIKESIDGTSLYASLVKKDCIDDYTYHSEMLLLISGLLNQTKTAESQSHSSDVMVPGILEAAVLENEINSNRSSLLRVENESSALIKALMGDYIEPGLSGSPRDGLNRIMPTGRNFYLMDTQKVPTQSAYAIGVEMADQLISQHQKDDGLFPEKVAMNMISTDISMTRGEQLSQVLALLGVTPIWNESGIVMDVKAIPLEALGRPRIDVIIRISGVLRDSYPDLIALMDRAVQMVATLKEPETLNFVRRNTLKTVNEMTGAEAMDKQTTWRRATMRIFGDKPGTYGSGVDLALKASAWESEDELAKIFTSFSGYAYGDGLSGEVSHKEFVDNVKSAELVFETSVSNRYDLLSSGYSASVIGGFNMVKNQFDQDALKQYHGTSNNKEKVVITTMADELNRIMEGTFFNPLWNRSVIDKGYSGAAEVMRKAQTIFSWKCTTKNIDDMAIDEMVKTYLGDPEMVNWLSQENNFAIEEMSRRFLELQQRKKWNPSAEALEILTNIYMKIEGDMEELMEESQGDYQGGTIEIVGHQEVEAWHNSIKKLDVLFDSERNL